MHARSYQKICNEYKHIQFAQSSGLDNLSYEIIKTRNSDTESIDEIRLYHTDDFYFIKMALLHELKNDDETIIQ